MDFSRYTGLAKKTLLELGLEFQPEQFYSLIQSILTGLSPALVEAMIEKNVPWPVTDEQIVRISDFRDFMTHITPERVFDLLEASRPDLAKIIENHNEQGAVWFVTNIQNLRGRVMAVPEPPQTVKEYKQLEEQPEPSAVAGDGQAPLMALVCATCKEKWLVLEDDLDKVRGCPFCLAEAPLRQVPDDAGQLPSDEEEPRPRLRI